MTEKNLLKGGVDLSISAENIGETMRQRDPQNPLS